MFMQRLHQIAPMKEIAQKIKENLVNAEKLKHVLGQICCERYPDTNQFMRERHALQKNLALYAEGTECTDKPVWGDWKLGRLLGFLYDDTRAAMNCPVSTSEERNAVQGSCLGANTTYIDLLQTRKQSRRSV